MVRGVIVRCSVCNGDGWVAYPTWLDAAKKKIRIRKVRCPQGCALRNPDEPNVLPDFPHDDEEVASDH